MIATVALASLGVQQGKFEEDPRIRFIFTCLAVEHIFALIFAIIRAFDIAKRGQPDERGVYRTRLETRLQIVEVFVDSVLFGYVINELKNRGYDKFHDNSVETYWILIDLIIMGLNQLFAYISQVLAIK